MATIAPPEPTALLPGAEAALAPAAVPAAIPGPLSVAQLLDRSFRLYRARFGVFVSLAALFLLPQALLTGLGTGRVVASYMGLMRLSFDTPGDVALPGPSVASTTALMLGSALLSALLMLFCSAVLTRYSIDALHGRAPTRWETVRSAWERMGAMVGMSLLRLLGLMVVGVLVWLMLALFFFIVAAGASLFAGVLGGEGTGTMIFFALVIVMVVLLAFVMSVLLFSPLVYFYLRWFVATPVVVNEQAGPRAALRTSWRMTKGSTLRLLGYGLLLYIMSAVVVSGPVGIVQWLSLLAVGSAAQYALVTAISVLVSALLSILWQPLYAIAVVLLYFDLRVRRESYDLSLKIDALAAELAGPPAPAGAAVDG